MIKVGVVGAGFIGPAHIEAIRRLGVAEVVAIAAHTQELADEKARELNIPLAYGDVDALLSNPEIQVVHNCTPNHVHAEINKKIILAGKHVFSEKPLCMNLAEAHELAELVKDTHLVHGVSFVYRKFSMVQQAAAMVEDGDVGKVFFVHGCYLQDWMLLETDYNWRVEPEHGGNSRAFADIGSHWCDTIQYVTGKKISKVFADLAIAWPERKAARNTASTFTAGQPAATEYDVREVKTEDFGSILVVFEDGSRGSFAVSQVSAGRKNQLQLEVNGSKMSLGWDQEVPQQLWLGYRDQPNQVLSDDPSLMKARVATETHYPGGHIEGWPDAFKNMMKEFYHYILSGKRVQDEKPGFATFFDGANVMAVIDAVLESNEKKGWVDVKPI
ncbi:TPA: Gfo/Idh/MocA family oxidoreductase [Klebsiella pneumoniae]|nr:Gfo/Idh/MocA family oxidoreductase [Klebsiella pneumoniae]HDQ3433188.1 Gfo/Idh/MocA family oxidoreductase [Klebsiella pneumoniae]